RALTGRDLDRTEGSHCQGRRAARRTCYAGHNGAAGEHLRRALETFEPTGDEDEPLWGAFTPGAQLMMGADEEGTYIFRLIDANTLDYCYTEAGPSARAVCARLARQR